MMRQARQTGSLQEEARELLAELESALLELDQNRDDGELVGRAFRALHTIKGSGAMFGFDDIAGFTHNLETAFDRLRNGQLAATRELINLALAAGDQIKNMLDAGAGSWRGGPDALPDDSQRSCEANGFFGTQKAASGARLRRLFRGESDRIDQRSEWRIRFQPHPGILRNGANPLSPAGRTSGTRQLRIELDSSGIPPLSASGSGALLSGLGPGSDDRGGRPRPSAMFSSLSRTSANLRSNRSPIRPRLPAAVQPNPAPRSTAEARAAQGTGASLRVSADKLDQLVNLVGELVTVQAHLSELAARHDDPDILADLRRDRASDRGAARQLDEHPHAAAQGRPSNGSAGWCTTWEPSCTKKSS